MLRWWALLVPVALAGCGGGGARCVPGASATCACTDGRAGAQLCGPDGTFGPCIREAINCGAPLASDRDGGPETQLGRGAVSFSWTVNNQPASTACPAGAEVTFAATAVPATTPPLLPVPCNTGTTTVSNLVPGSYTWQATLSLTSVGGIAATVVNGIAATVVSNHTTNVPVIDFPFPPVIISISFLTSTSWRTLTCSEAMVVSTQLIVVDRDLNLERVNVEQPCTTGDRFRVTLERGNYLVNVRGLNSRRTICYESVIPVRIDPDAQRQYNFVIPQHPDGMQRGCIYPAG